MRRKFLSVVLCMCMMLTMAPFAFAEENGTPTISDGGGSGSSNAVAQIERTGTSYDTLQNAVNAAQENDTILVLSDTNITATGLDIPFNKVVTLDLNGHEVKAANTNNGNIKVQGKLILKDRTDINKTGEGQGKITTTSSIYAYGTVDKVLVCALNGEFVMESGLIDAATNITDNKNNGQFAVGVQNESQNASVTINGGKIKAGWYAIAGYGGCLTYNGDITVNGGILESTADYAIYHPQAGTTTINGGVIYGQSGGIAINRGTLVVNDGMITSKGIGNTGSWGDGTGNLNNAAIHANAEYGDVSVSIKNGKVIAEGNAVTIDQGPGHNATVAISGGTFSSDVTNYVAENYTCIQNNDKYTVKALNEVAVAKIGDILYPTLAKAIEAVPDNGESATTVTLIKDSTEDVTIPANKKVALELNGKTLTNVSSNTIANNGTLTITGEGTVDNVTHAKAAIYNKGTVTLNGGTYDRSNEDGVDADNAGTNTYYTILNHGNMTVDSSVTVRNKGHHSSLFENGYYSHNSKDGIDNPTLTITSGTYEGGLNTIKNDDDATLIINGGTFTNYTQAAFQNHGTATVTAGSFIANSKYAIDNCGCDATHDLGKLEISGGTFNGTLYIRSAYSNVTISDGYFNGSISKTGGTLTITGGHFTSDPTTYVKSTAEAPRYVVDSDVTGYSFKVTPNAPQKAPVIVADKTEVTNAITDNDAKNAVDAIINNANVDGVAEAITDTAKNTVLAKAGVNENDQKNPNIRIIIDVSVAVKALDATTDRESKITSLTFEAVPAATVTTVTNNVASTPSQPIDIPNSYLNGNITVKLPLPEGFTPKQIKHTSTDGSVEYFLLTEKRGAKTFTIDENNCAVFTITKFSTFEVSGKQTYVEPSSGGPGSSGGSISTPTTYAVNVNAATNGAVAADKKTASKGTTVTVTASPSKGYVVDAVKVVDKDGKDVAVTGKDGKYVFTMPGSAVTVTGTFKAETPAPVALPFTDVKSGNWFYDAVKYAYAQGLMTGTSATTFAPNGTMNRAMIVTVLYRLEKSPAVTGASKFTDVPAGQWYSDAVAWAAANKIVNGYDETTFGPMNAVTREQMAAILFRYEQVKGLENVTLEENLNRFPDQNKISAYAIPALQWAVGQKIINGNADGTLDPTGTATRAQVAQIFTNLLNK